MNPQRLFVGKSPVAFVALGVILGPLYMNISSVAAREASGAPLAVDIELNARVDADMTVHDEDGNMNGLSVDVSFLSSDYIITELS